MKNFLSALFVNILLVALSGFLFYWGGSLLKEHMEFNKKSEQITATVFKVEKVLNENRFDDDDPKYKRIVYITYEYGGERYQDTIDGGLFVKRGQKVKIHVDPEKPSSMMEDSYSEIVILATGVLFAFIPLIMFGMYIYRIIIFFKNRTRNHY